MRAHRDNGSVIVSVERVQNREIVDQDYREELIEMEESGTASVGVGMGMTINLGNYQSARIDVHVTLPCAPEAVDETYDKAAEFCREHVRKEASTIKKK